MNANKITGVSPAAWNNALLPLGQAGVGLALRGRLGQPSLPFLRVLRGL